ncbi:MAG: hypothetical protein ACYTF3_05380 [Planctomycetota bacterium]|jgi:hypothetical protein
MTAPSTIALCLALLPALACAVPSTEPAAAGEAFGRIEAQMAVRWSSPERRTWRIEHRAVHGLGGESAWYIAGTPFWVRLYPEVFSLEELDQASTYEIDAVALAQNYGVIDFYIYDFPERVAATRP